MKFASLRYGKLFKIPRRIFKKALVLIYPIVVRIFPLPKIASIETTIEKIRNENCSIIRFGDGEILYIVDHLSLPFQSYTSELSDKLIEILKSKHPNILIGLPLGYKTLDYFDRQTKEFWKGQIVWSYPRFRKYIVKTKQYYNANISRLYYGFEDKTLSEKYFAQIKMLWQNREILIIEGEKSRLGVGNDLFQGVKDIIRILAPPENAYSKIDLIFNYTNTFSKKYLVLIALGPAAKPLAFCLAKTGFQTIDIGNIDIEYEWFLAGMGIRFPVKGKYTSEAEGGRVVADIYDPIYEKQIVYRF